PTVSLTLSLHDALPISVAQARVQGHEVDADVLGEYYGGSVELVFEDLPNWIGQHVPAIIHGLKDCKVLAGQCAFLVFPHGGTPRSEEHTSELQSREKLV